MFAQPIHPSTATALPPPPPICSERKYVRNLKPNLKPGFDLSQTRKPRFTEGTRVWKLADMAPTNATAFWKQMKSTVYSLAPVAEDFLCAPASQTYMERIFSVWHSV